MTIAKVLYTAHTKVTGGRDGHAMSSDGLLDVRLAVPKEMGGPGGGTNPEQLFAAGYAACFLGAMRVVAAQRNASLPVGLSIDSSVGIGQIHNGFGIEASLRIYIPGMNSTEAESLVEAAHRVCPYSNATRNNIDVRLKVITEGVTHVSDDRIIAAKCKRNPSPSDCRGCARCRMSSPADRRDKVTVHHPAF